MKKKLKIKKKLSLTAMKKANHKAVKYCNFRF